jgi:D-amino-acid dehydrogenase
MLGFTNWAVSYLQDFMEQRGMEKHCGLNRLGALKVIYGAEAGGKALSLSSLEKSVELDCKQLLDLEPSLKHRQEMGLPTRGVLEPNAAAANGEIFAHELAKIATAEGKVKFMYGTAVHSMEEGPRTEGGHRQITALQLSAGQRLSVDPNTEVIVAAGAWTPQLMWGVGMYTPIYPMKGYCIALQVPAGVPEDHLPQRIVYDKYTYVSRLGDQVRITSIGEFAGWDTKPTPEVDKSLRAAAKRQLPALADLITETHTRCGLRPFSADGIILLGRVQPFQNLSINCGPGFNGWKTALGAGRVLADIVAGGGKDEKDFDASFLSPSGRMKQAPLLSRISLKRWT